MASFVRIAFRNIPFKGSSRGIWAEINGQSIRTITSRLEDLPPKPKPWNYNERSYTYFHYLFDKTTPRFDENTKLIVVEGPVAAGKSRCAKEIAKAFGMLYLPEANLDMEYINSYGYDIRQLDPMLPPDCRSFDIVDFLKNPKHKLTTRMQIQLFMIKYSQYIDALAHILSTGQGVVLDRCVYSDFVFVEAMYNQRYLSKAAYKKYYEYRDNTIHELLRPHLVVYLDVPVPRVLENINKRNITCEKRSQAMNPQYLEVLEKNYKQNYLKEISTHAELLVYDWTVEGDMEVVVEDIEAIDFEKYDDHDTNLKDWRQEFEEDWACLRYKYADQKDYLMAGFNVPDYDCPELLVDAMDIKACDAVMDEAPGNRYAPGFNINMGDKSWLFKYKLPKKNTLPLRERKKM
ncbi:NADH dehydrogenase [ubiquinone] 1 alpha subcomplex subunit 10, mitochondrial [Euwallacea similis]|uniref:NADH dehydrogenase [ubiquinone] 1 alpha subcomplex subunit 10, mitochondrial n=1 Tax=Euwallacea similis TaxID=1736056 RepID=UPI00345003B6